MIEKRDLISVGTFLKPHALNGELNAKLNFENCETLPEVPLIVEMDGIFVPFYIESLRAKGHFTVLIKLEGQDSEEDARSFVNKTIYIRKTDLGKLDTDEDCEGEYADDLIGYTVINSDNQRTIGEITDIDLSTQNALFIVDTDRGTVYIPVSEDFITAIDDNSQTIEMSLPDGLLELNQK